ncbi:MAG: hypothetical protein HY072_10605 [Deltaproteobacteria bacterium]|nr:hypothetical protein [Deltaproteobacteria bacterium]
MGSYKTSLLVCVLGMIFYTQGFSEDFILKLPKAKSVLTTISIELPFQTTYQATTEVDVYLEFYQVPKLNLQKEDVFLGAVQLTPGQSRVTLELDYRMSRFLFQTFPQRIAKLKTVFIQKDHGNQENSTIVHGDVFIAGPADFTCNTPVIIIDENALGGVSTAPLFDNNIVFFIHSKNQNIKNLIQKNTQYAHKSIVLSNSGQNLSEKFLSLKDHLHDTGACILGLAGKEYNSDGAIAKQLKIPFFAVNQQDRAIMKTIYIDRPYCEWKYDFKLHEQPPEDLLKHFYMAWPIKILCNRNQTSSNGEEVWLNLPDYWEKFEEAPESPLYKNLYFEQTIKKTIVVEEPVQTISENKPEQLQINQSQAPPQPVPPPLALSPSLPSLPSLPSPIKEMIIFKKVNLPTSFAIEYYCMKNNLSPPAKDQSQAVKKPLIIYDDENPYWLFSSPKTINPQPQGWCDEGYDIKIAKDPKEVLDHLEPAFTISAFPNASYYAHDWRELSFYLEQKILSVLSK